MSIALIVTIVLLLALGFCDFLLKCGKNYQRNQVVRFSGSLKLAVLLLVITAFVMAFATIMEARHGAEIARHVVYDSVWFGLLITAIWLNIFFATILRLPFKQLKTGFFLTHSGILILLIGTLVTRIKGIEGHISILEGEKTNMMTLAGNMVKISNEQQDQFIIDLNEIIHKRQNPHHIKFTDTSSYVRILQYLPHSHIDFDYLAQEPAAIDTENVAALKFRLSSDSATMENWLATANPALHEPNIFNMGQLSFSLQELRSQTELDSILNESANNTLENAILKISFDGGKNFEIVNIVDCWQKDYALGSEKLKIRLTQIYQNATVEEGGKLRERGGKDSNPAISFTLFDHNNKEFISGIRFQNMPFYQGRHNADYQEPQITIAGLERFKSNTDLEFAVFKNEFYYLNARLTEQQIFKLAASGLQLQILKLIPSARIERLAHHATADTRAEYLKPCIQLQLYNAHQESEIITMLYNEKQNIKFDGQTYNLHFTENTIALPFSVQLQAFRKIDYPNTRRAMSYESDILVTDIEPDSSGQIKQFATTISMNNVLDYRGWRFFQSGFRFINEQQAYSTFQVASNPGIETIYVGSIIMILGFIYLFWLEQKKYNLRNVS